MPVGALCVTTDLEEVARAEALIKQGKAAEAYKLLEPFEFEYAGDIDFDYWLGIAALESGQPGKATLALERALTVNPDFLGARLDLARAYFALGDVERARTEFENLLKLNPPAAAKLTIERYLTAIEQGAALGKSRLTGYLEATLGHDTNVGAASSQSQVFLPLFGVVFTQDQSNLKQADSYFAVGGGFEFNYPVGRHVSLFIGGDYKNRANVEVDTFNTISYDGRVGVQYALDRDAFRVTGSYGQFYLENDYNRESKALSLEWRRAVDRWNQLSVFGVAGRLRYPQPDQQGNNANYTLGGAGWLRTLDEEKRAVVFVNAYTGYERDTDERIDGDKKFYGGRVLGQYGIRSNAELFGSFSAQQNDYELQNFLFSEYRKDRLLEWSVGINWRIDPKWTIKPQVVYTHNLSSIVTNAYDRWDASITARRDFRSF